MAHIDLSSAKPCPLCSILVTKEGLMSGEGSVRECAREGCPLREAEELKQVEAEEGRAADIKEREKRRVESKEKRRAFFARIRDWWLTWRTRKTPEAKAGRLQAAGEKLTRKREELSVEIAELQTVIRMKRNAYQQAGEVERKHLQPELKLLLRRHRHRLNELGILAENEGAMEIAAGRMREVAAYRENPITESEIDDIAIDLEGSAQEADRRVEAIEDLEKAGQRRARLQDSEIDSERSFEELLAGFEAGEAEVVEKDLEKQSPADLHSERAEPVSDEPTSPQRRLEEPEQI